MATVVRSSSTGSFISMSHCPSPISSRHGTVGLRSVAPSTIRVGVSAKAPSGNASSPRPLTIELPSIHHEPPWIGNGGSAPKSW